MSTATNASESQSIEPPQEQGRSEPADFEAKIVCAECGKETDRLHLGCPLCEDCCDCRPG